MENYNSNSMDSLEKAQPTVQQYPVNPDHTGGPNATPPLPQYSGQSPPPMSPSQGPGPYVQQPHMTYQQNPGQPQMHQQGSYGMPPPQQQYQQQPMQPMQQGGGGTHFQTAVAIPNLGMGSAPVDCPSCGKRGMTRLEYATGNTTHAWALGICCLTGCLCFIPYLMNSLKDVKHHCGGCGVLLATWHKSGNTQAHMHA